MLILITVHNNHQLISAGRDQGRTDVLFIPFTTTSFGLCFPSILSNSNKFFGVNVFFESLLISSNLCKNRSKSAIYLKILQFL